MTRRITTPGNLTMHPNAQEHDATINEKDNCCLKLDLSKAIYFAYSGSGLEYDSYHEKAIPIELFSKYEEDEKVACTASLFNDVLYVIENPGRHHHIIHIRYHSGHKKSIGGIQSFITSHGRFIDRKMAGKIALQTGQIEKLKVPPYLYSEDIW